MTKSIEKQVLATIYGHGRGWAFSQKDFAELGTREAIAIALYRLVEKSTIRRVIRGIYDYPKYSELLEQEMAPDIHQVASAIARKFGWRIQPSGVAALNWVGLSTQVLSKYVYISTGPDRSYDVGATSIRFEHAAPKETGFKLDESGLIVQALKALGEKRITDDTIEQLRRWLPESKRTKVLKETKTVTGWVYEAIRRVCSEDDKIG